MSRHATGGAQKQKQPRRNAAEQERIAAERAKKIAQEKTAAAERARLEEQEKARLAAEKAKQAEQEKVASEKEAERKEQLAALPPPAEKSEPSEIDLPRALQSELRRVFNRHAGLKLDFRVASVDALDAVKGKSGRICPVACDAGFRADGERCISIVCKSGFRINDDNECEKNPDKKPIAKSKEPKRKPADRAKADAASAKPQASGQIYCNGQGCRAAPKGCRVEKSNVPQRDPAD